MKPSTAGIPRSSSYTTTLEPRIRDGLDDALERLSLVVLGKERQIRLALCCLLCRGHLLIEDLPGMGKTLLAHSLARVLGLTYKRIQFTSDVLPADIVGVSVFDKLESSFRFMPGPIFTQVVLADEINRATPKSQSALLEAMEEGQVTIDGETRMLPAPFFVIATQNPVSQSGTFALPESQLDRFLMRIQLGYPEPDAERELLIGGDRRKMLESIEPALSEDDLVGIQAAVDAVQVSDPLVDYVQRLVAYTREDPEFALGMSPRGALALIHAARAWALIQDRTHVVPEDVQAVLSSVVEHRIRDTADYAGHSGGALAQKLLSNVDVVR